MRWSRGVCASLVLMLMCGVQSGLAADAGYKVEILNQAPAGLSPAVTAALETKGYRVIAKDGTVCDVWLAKEVAVKPGFKPSLQVKYGFVPGQLMGAIHFPEKPVRTDFRGQNLPTGTFTLRFGLQPNDGNHLGTSDTRDFVCASPAKLDVDPKPIENEKDLFKLSAKAVNTSHPTIFLLLPPPDKAVEGPGVKHIDDKEFVVLSTNITTKQEGKPVPVPILLVTVGKGEG